MRYIIVNERRPRGLPRFCAYCCSAIDATYTRDLQMSIIYCKPECFETHIFETNVAAGAIDAPRPKLLAYEKGGLR